MDTPADFFDFGSGRVDLTKAGLTGLVLNETYANFVAADPSLDGDPKTLNIASLQNNACVGECSWTRTFNECRWRSCNLQLMLLHGNDSYPIQFRHR